MIWLLLSVLCFFIFRHFITSLEIKENGEWIDCYFPLWIWIIAGIICLVPLLNFLMLIAFEGIATAEIKESYSHIRLKEGKKIYLLKLIDILNKKY